ncbi:MAG: DUF839 domain-containing protein [Flavobacteriales bacterium]|nr:DUF839 domain-containing protein [Flavobacteriales bacterium]
MSHLDRRSFLKFLGTLSAYGVIPMSVSACEHKKWPGTENALGFKLNGIEPTDLDQVVLADGFHYDLLIRFNQEIKPNEFFGFNNDFLCFIPDEADTEQAILWVNHENVHTPFVSGRMRKTDPSKTEADLEMYHVGGSIIRLIKKDGKWTFRPGDPINRRLNAHTPIPFSGGTVISGSNIAVGTLANCAGGFTPWGTILTCEENYHDCFGERDPETGLVRSGLYRWEKVYSRPPEHYGWVVEVEPKSGKAQKHVRLGRFAHECATCTRLKDGRVVVYSGDDKDDQCLYKFISSEPDSLVEGTLYVADVDKGRWISLDIESNEKLRERFSDQLEIQINTRLAADLVGGSKLDRPEDIEIDPISGDVFVALTNNKPKKEYFGQILKISEKDGNYESLEFTAETFRTGGVESGFACPDNMAFDISGNLWFTSDMSGSSMHKEPYTKLKNNGLFVVPRFGERAGEVIQIASAPTDAEFTGPTFSSDYKTLFLSVQHPGEMSPDDLSSFTSHWPDGEGKPDPGIILITGPALEYLTHINLPEGE